MATTTTVDSMSADPTTVNPTIDPTTVDLIFTSCGDEEEKILKLYQKMVLELYQEESKDNDYNITDWKVADRGGKQDPPDGTLAVVINTGATGSIRIFERDNRHLRGVQHKTQIAIIPWNRNWQFMAIGKCNIRFIMKNM